MRWKNLFSWFQPAPHARFTLDDFIAQVGQMQRLGPMSKVMERIPGMRELSRAMNVGEGQIEAQLGRMRAIYSAMTTRERKEPELLNGSRRSRIAAGAGVHTREAASFVQQFRASREMMDRVRRVR